MNFFTRVFQSIFSNIELIKIINHPDGSLKWIYTVSVFRPFLLLREKVRDFSSAFLYVQSALTRQLHTG